MLIDRLNYRKIAKLAKFQAEKLLPSDCNEVRLILVINLPYEINLCTFLSLSFFLVLFFFFLWFVQIQSMHIIEILKILNDTRRVLGDFCHKFVYFQDKNSYNTTKFTMKNSFNFLRIHNGLKNCPIF